MRSLISIFLIFTSTVLYSQKDVLFKRWTTGQEFYYAEKYSDSLITFSGGNLHEGGAMFTTKSLSSNKHMIVGRSPEDNHSPSIGEKGNIIEVMKISNDFYLIIYDETNAIQGVLFELKGSLEDLVIKNKVNFELAGKYRDETGKGYTFYPNQLKAKGLSKQESYVFEYEYDFPIQVITLNENKSFYYEKLPDGLMIYEANQNEYHEWEKSTRIKKLTKIDWFNHTRNQNLKGKYPFASTNILTNSILDYFSKYELHIMRNEIFARYGYKFKTKEMKNYFESKEWYRAIYEDVNSKLSELEKLNIQIIKSRESK